ncbi:rhodanese-like domain-containing protein [Halorubrum sp. AD140]|uniref:sulfurtransferase n=1 Tax=Halorubrum sp. AD140 TaxID=3050073 RepID=UPI002ACC79E6|nr:rhodanese-like domain-containing protein [Halorubrum sp. AD140]MDZ5810330.1 rhodanese-like domain-containing protein [Halorubrum sp. AD140]
MNDRQMRTSRRSVLASAGAALAATAGCLGETDDEPPEAYTTPAAEEFDGVVDSQWLEENLDDVHLLDVRDADAFDDARIPGAYHFPDSEMLDSYAEETDDGFEASPDVIAWTLAQAGIEPDDDVVVYGAESDLWETYAIYTLNALGHEGRVSLLDGGFTVWDAAGGETVSEAPEAREASYEADLDLDVVATREFVADNVDEEGAAIPILDMRTPEEYWGVDERGDLDRFGHVAGATNLNFVQSIDDEAGRLRSPEELETLWIDDAGLSADETTVAYCQTAIRASVGWFVLDQLGFEDVRNYEGSWADWGTLSEEDGYYYTTGEDTGRVVDTFA